MQKKEDQKYQNRGGLNTQELKHHHGWQPNTAKCTSGCRMNCWTCMRGCVHGSFLTKSNSLASLKLHPMGKSPAYIESACRACKVTPRSNDSNSC